MESSQISKLSVELKNNLFEIRELRNQEWDLKNLKHKKMWDEMVDKAHELHKLVKPVHKERMIKNREYEPDDRMFYNSIHSVDDLLEITILAQLTKKKSCI